MRLPSPRRLLAVSTAAFLLPALALSVPSGYSWGAVLLLLLGLAAWPAVVRERWPLPPEMRYWAMAVGAMGLVWGMHSFSSGHIVMHTLGLDRALKYGLMLLAIAAVLRGLPSTKPLYWGCWAGAGSAGLTAAWQWWGLHWERASGFTNAIQFGNLALLLALWSWVWGRHATRPVERILSWMAVLCGAFASLASGSRGGWIVAPFLILLVLWLDRPAPLPSHGPAKNRYRVWMVSAALTTACFLAVFLLLPVQQRAALAVQEWQAWRVTGNGETSVGQRLVHWQLAWDVALERPVLGWGQQGYDQRKQQAIAQKKVPESLSQFNHAHHEWLDMFAKKGIVGVLVLALFFAVPGVIYGRILLRPAHSVPPEHQTAAMCGFVTVVGFLGFGMTQVMFAHNNANMVYLFMNLLWLAVLVNKPVHCPTSPITA